MSTPPEIPLDDCRRAGVVRSGLTWFGLASVGQVGFRLISLAVLARILTPEEFGAANAAQIVILITTDLLGIGTALVQRKHLTSAHVATCLHAAFWSSAVVASICLVAAPAYSRLLHVPEAEELLRFLTIAIMAQGVAAILEAISQRELRFRRLALVRLFAYAFGFVGVSVTAAIWGLGAWALALGIAAEAVLRMFLLASLQGRVPLVPSRGAFRDILGVGFGVTLGRLFWQVAGQADSWILASARGAASLGVYGRAQQLVGMPLALLSQAVDRTLLPLMAPLQGDNAALARSYTLALTYVATCVPLCAWILIAVAPEFVSLLLGPTWADAVLPLQLLLLAAPFRFTAVSETVAAATGRVYRRAAQRALYGVMVVLLALSLVQYGAPGVATAILIGSICYWALSLRLASVACEMPFLPVLLIYARGIFVAGGVLGSSLVVWQFAAAPRPAIVNGAIIAALYMALSYAALRFGLTPLGRVSVRQILQSVGALRRGSRS